MLELGFVIDATWSMDHWIDRAQNTLSGIIKKVYTECQDCCELQVRVTVVAYRDLSDDKRFMLFPFSQNVEAAKKFIKNLKATGGGDAPEDVCGGLKLALMQDWSTDGIKKMFLIADAPCHGLKYNPKGRDDYPDGTPDAPDLEALMDEMCKKNIDFDLIKLTPAVDLMADDMQKFYGDDQSFEMKDMSRQWVPCKKWGERLETQEELTQRFLAHAIETTIKTVRNKVAERFA